MRVPGSHDEQLVFFAYNRLSFLSFDTSELEREIVTQGLNGRMSEP